MSRMYAFIGMPGPVELAIIVGIALLLFGPSQLPKVARSLGSVIPSFRKGMKDVEKEIKEIETKLNE